MEFHTAQSLRLVHGLDLGSRRPSPFRRWLRALVERARQSARRSDDRELLMAKSPRDLADIGLTRADVVAAYHGGSRWFGSKRAGGRNA